MSPELQLRSFWPDFVLEGGPVEPLDGETKALVSNQKSLEDGSAAIATADDF